jgi:hypothetical protein
MPKNYDWDIDKALITLEALPVESRMVRHTMDGYLAPPPWRPVPTILPVYEKYTIEDFVVVNKEGLREILLRLKSLTERGDHEEGCA